MKKLKFLFISAMLLIAPMVFGENDESLSIEIASNDDVKPKRDSFYSDILLYIESDRVIIQFNGDFGDGHAEVRNLTNNDFTSSDIYAQYGGTDELFITITNTSTYEFSIEFDDGRSSRIVW